MAGWSSAEPFLVAQRGPAGPDYRMGLIFCYLFFYCFWAATAHRCLCSLSILPPIPCRHAPCTGCSLTLGKGFSWLPSHSPGAGRWGAAGHGAAVGALGHCHNACCPVPSLSISSACFVCPGNQRIMESFRLEMLSKSLLFNSSSSSAKATTNPYPCVPHLCSF